MIEQIIFVIFAAITLGAAFMVVSARSLVHSALWLVVALFGVAMVYVLLNAGFFAAVQVVIYIGAIAILFIFATMLTRRIMQDTGPQANANWWAALLSSVALFAGLVWMLSNWSGFSTRMPVVDTSGSIGALGSALVSANGYVLPFELASVLLVAALIGAIYVALGRK
jgi:NADH-quinone oxidoreductase subunit J